MMNITDYTIKKFSEFLTLNWDNISNILDLKSETKNNKNYILEDWIEFNWEILVRLVICDQNKELLTEYGANDYDYFTPRKLKENLTQVEPYCKSKEELTCLLTNKLIDPSKLDFEHFISFEKNGYSETPPFDYVRLTDQNSETYVLHKDQIVFDLRRYYD